MSVILQGDQLREIALGRGPVSKLTTLSGAAVHQLYTVAGGRVLITALWGVTTTAMAGANTVNLQTDPTTGDTVVIVTATDLGTTDTAAGTTIGTVGVTTDTAANTIIYKKGGFPLMNLIVTTGEVEADVTGAGADGAITWYCTWIPLTSGATLVAAA